MKTFLIDNLEKNFKLRSVTFIKIQTKIRYTLQMKRNYSVTKKRKMFIENFIMFIIITKMC